MKRSLRSTVGKHPQSRVRGYFLFALAPRNPTLPRKEEPSNRSTAIKELPPCAKCGGLLLDVRCYCEGVFPSQHQPWSACSHSCFLSFFRFIHRRSRPTSSTEPLYFTFPSLPCFGNTRSTGRDSSTLHRASVRLAIFSSRRSKQTRHPSSPRSSQQNRLRTRWSISARESLAFAKGAVRPFIPFSPPWPTQGEIMKDMIPYMPSNVRDVIEHASQQLQNRESYSEQARDYPIDCANGDKVDIHETTCVWIREIG